MLSVSFKDKVRKKLGLKTSDEKIEDGLRALRDILDDIGEHDLAMNTDDMLVNGSKMGKCIFLLVLYQTVPLIALGKNLKKMRKMKGMLDDIEKD